MGNGDTLDEDWPQDEPTNFDGVLMNPPYSAKWSAVKGFLDDPRFAPCGQKLCANVAAQIVAFACGKSDDNLNKNFKGGRPSSIITGDALTPETLGALLAHFENKIMFQGFLWNINSFDQEGVQLGKVLAKRVLAHDTDGALKIYSELLNI